LAGLGRDGAVVASAQVEAEVVAAFGRDRLASVVPNPFNPSTTVRFTIAAAGPAEVVVVDARGRLVRGLWRDSSPRLGSHAAAWDGRDSAGRAVASGVYWARLAVGGRQVDARALALVR
jgi:hypothetical protein